MKTQSNSNAAVADGAELPQQKSAGENTFHIYLSIMDCPSQSAASSKECSQVHPRSYMPGTRMWISTCTDGG